MKTLIKLITTLIAIFTITILSTTPTYAAISVDVYCDGDADQIKMYEAFANDVTINLHGDSNGQCVFTFALGMGDRSGNYFDDIIIQGNGVTIITSPDYSEQSELFVVNDQVVIADTCGDKPSQNFTYNNFTLKNGNPENFTGTGLGLMGFGFCGQNINNLNNITIDGFFSGVYSGGGGGSVIANGLFVTNALTLPGMTETLAVFNEDNAFNWISGRSDAEYAIVSVDIGSIVVNGVALGEEDFDISGIFGEDVYFTNARINQLVNCGFPVGSQWDICIDTDGGGEEPDGGNNGNEIEAPGTGISSSINTMTLSAVVLLIAGCGVMMVKRARS